MRIDPDRANLVLAQTELFCDETANEEDKEILRAKLREKLWWHLNHDTSNDSDPPKKLTRWQNLYEKLVPTDLVLCH